MPITIKEIVGSVGGTLNYVPKYTPDGFKLGNSQIYDNGTNVGIGTASPTRKLSIYGSVASASTEASIESDTGNSVLYLDAFKSSAGTSGGGLIKFLSTGVEHGSIKTNNSNSWFHINSDNGYNLVLQNGSTTNVNINASYGVIFGNGTQNNFISTNAGDVGIGLNFLTPSARLHTVGVDSTSSNYAFKADNSSNSPLLYVRNDGVVLINSSTAYNGVGTGTPISLQSQSNEAYLFGNNSNRTYGEIRWGSGQRHTQTYLENAVTAGFIEYFNSRVDFNFDVARFLSKGGTEYMRLTSDGISIKYAAPQSQFHVFGVNSNNINLRLEPLTNVIEDTRGGTVNTTDATANVTVHSIPVAVGVVLSLESTIVYRKTGGAGVGTTGDGTTIKLNSSVKNVGGTLTLDTVQNTYAGTINSIAGVSATYTISGTNVLVSVTGVLNDNITWNVITKVNTVA